MNRLDLVKHISKSVDIGLDFFDGATQPAKNRPSRARRARTAIAMHAMIKRLVRPARDELSTAQRQASYECACAILAGRFPDLRSALSHPEFLNAVPALVNETLNPLLSDEATIEAARTMEEERRQQDIESYVKSTGRDGKSVREDMSWLESTFDRLMTKADRHAIGGFSIDEIRVFRWCFELAPKYDRRYWSYKFQFAVFRDLVEFSTTSVVHGGEKLHSLAASIFGDGAYCAKQIKNMVTEGKSEPPEQGRPTAFPRDVETVIFRYAAMLRSHNQPVYKSTILAYAMQLLEGTEASLNFALKKDGEYVVCRNGKVGGVEWDMSKLDTWFKRRFIGDRKDGGARTGNQVLLDVHRAKWHSFEAMLPYYKTHVQALVDEGICYYNTR